MYPCPVCHFSYHPSLCHPIIHFRLPNPIYFPTCSLVSYYLPNSANNVSHNTTFSYVASLGTNCFTSYQLKLFQLKLFSLPFDWCFSSCKMITSCLQDNFQTLLNKDLYQPVAKKRQCHHKLYGFIWNHYNPATISSDYDYIKRCVKRWRLLLLQPEPILFVLTSLLEKDWKQQEDKFVQLYTSLAKVRYHPFVLLVILVKNNTRRYWNAIYFGGLVIVYLNVVSTCLNGKTFSLQEDNKLYQSIFQSFEFDLKKLQ